MTDHCCSIRYWQGNSRVKKQPHSNQRLPRWPHMTEDREDDWRYSPMHQTSISSEKTKCVSLRDSQTWMVSATIAYGQIRNTDFWLAPTALISLERFIHQCERPRTPFQRCPSPCQTGLKPRTRQAAGAPIDILDGEDRHYSPSESTRKTCSP